MVNHVVLADGNEVERADRRHKLFARYGMEMERLEDDRTLFQSFCKPAEPGERYLVFIHMSAWARPEPEAAKWHASRRDNVAVVLYSFGNWLTKDFDGVADYEAALGQVYLIERPIKSDLDEHGFEILAKFVSEWKNNAPASELWETFAQLNTPAQLDLLPALSLMGQTYLAAHGKIDLGSNVVIPSDAAERTEQPEWWTEVLGDQYGFVNALRREVAVATHAAPLAALPHEMNVFKWALYETTGKVRLQMVEQMMRYLNGILPAT